MAAVVGLSQACPNNFQVERLAQFVDTPNATDDSRGVLVLSLSAGLGSFLFFCALQGQVSPFPHPVAQLLHHPFRLVRGVHGLKPALVGRAVVTPSGGLADLHQLTCKGVPLVAQARHFTYRLGVGFAAGGGEGCCLLRLFIRLAQPCPCSLNVCDISQIANATRFADDPLRVDGCGSAFQTPLFCQAGARHTLSGGSGTPFANVVEHPLHDSAIFRVLSFAEPFIQRLALRLVLAAQNQSTVSCNALASFLQGVFTELVSVTEASLQAGLFFLVNARLLAQILLSLDCALSCNPLASFLQRIFPEQVSVPQTFL